MFEQDYIMRMIHDLIRTIVKLVFHIETETISPYLVENPETRKYAQNLLEQSDSGSIREAEQALSALLKDNHTLDNLLVGLVFYSHLNELDEEYLSVHDFSSEEIKNGMKNLLSVYGLETMADTFFFDN